MALKERSGRLVASVRGWSPLRIIGRYGEFPAAINAIEKENLIVPSGQLETLKLEFYRQIASKQG